MKEYDVQYSVKVNAIALINAENEEEAKKLFEKRGPKLGYDFIDSQDELEIGIVEEYKE